MDALNDAIAPVRPYLLSLTHNLPTPLSDLSISLLGPQCHIQLLEHFDLSTSARPCLTLAVSKVLGIAIVSASAIVKLPQLFKLLSSRSAAGLSFLSYLLETTSFVITLAYSVRKGFPFSTYGESAFIAVQDVAIAVAILVFSKQQTGAAIFIGALGVAAYALFGDSGMVSMERLGWLQAGAGVLGVASKVPQILTIWREGGTGQLSAFAVFNYLAGSLVRIFTTLKEVDDTQILYGFIAGFVLNAVLAAQLVYYWNAPQTKPKTGKRRLGAPKAGHRGEPAGTGSGSSAATPRTKGAGTRRRG